MTAAAIAPAAARRSVAWASLAMLALAFAWFWPTLQHGLRSDDYLVVYYTDRLSGAVQWDRVFEEFTRPWFGGGELYRPLISVSFGVELALFPSPSGRHAFNVLFVAIAAAAAAATAGLLATQRRTLAAVVAGLLVVLHPATVETAAWIAARVTSLQMACATLAMLAYARHLVLGRRLWPAVLWHALALLSKEGAVTLPVSLLAIDLWRTGWSGWGARLRRLLPFAGLLLLYFGLRLLVLGRIGSADHDFAFDNLGNVAVRTAQLVVPPGPDGARSVWPLALLGLALVPLARRLGRWLLLLPVWFFLVLAPTQHLAAEPGVLYGRFVFDAVPGLALVLGLAASAPFLVTVAVATTLAALGWLASLALQSAAWLDRYTQEDQLGRATERALASAAATATAARPFAITGLPYLPVFHQKLWGVLGLQPFAPRDLAVLGLPELLVPDEKAPQFRYDAAVVHALLDAGGSVARFDHTARQFVAMAPPTPGTLTLRPDPAAPQQFTTPSPWPGSSVAAVEVRVPAPAAPPAPTRQLALRFLDDLPTAHAFGTLQKAAPSPVTWLDTSHALAPVLLHGLGLPFRGVHLEIDGAPPPVGTTVVLHGTLPVRPLPERTDGAQRSREQLFALTETPPAHEPLRCYLLLPTGVRHMDVPAKGAPMDAFLREHLRWALDLYAPLTVYWFWQTLPEAAGAPWRSTLDWANAR